MQRSALELLTCLDSASVAESLSVMLENEKLMHGKKCDYLASSDGAKITKDDRGKIADYFHNVATKLKIESRCRCIDNGCDGLVPFHGI